MYSIWKLVGMGSVSEINHTEELIPLCHGDSMSMRYFFLLSKRMETYLSDAYPVGNQPKLTRLRH